jgi:hypothetical protein
MGGNARLRAAAPAQLCTPSIVPFQNFASADGWFAVGGSSRMPGSACAMSSAVPI